MTFFQPLFKSLKRKAVLPEMVAGLDMIVEDIKQRNYLHAYDIYMRLAIGETPLACLICRHACIGNHRQPDAGCKLAD